MQSVAEFRHNMIDGQLGPNQVLSPAIIAAMGTVPREAFVPETYRQCAYIDEPVPLDGQRYLPSPLQLGKMLEALNPQPKRKALVLGGSTGYAAAVLHQLGCQTYMLEASQELANRARQILNKQGLNAIEVHTGSLHMGWNAAKPYDLILVDGGVMRLPDSWTSQLAESGRLTYVAINFQLPLPHRGRGFIHTVTRREGECINMTGEEVSSPILPGLEPKEGFDFA